MSQAPIQATQRDIAVGGSKRTRQGMLTAIRRLEEALARATPNRATAWRDEVLKRLTDLESAMTSQAAELRGDDGLMADLILENPRLSTRVAGLRDDYDRLVVEISGLRNEFATERAAEISSNVVDIRSRLASLIDDVRRFQTTETDLIYEAIQVDIGVGD